MVAAEALRSYGNAAHAVCGSVGQVMNMEMQTKSYTNRDSQFSLLSEKLSERQEPLVSIIINNYNYGRYLQEAIDSALAQTYQYVEVIVVDDGSTDNSRAIISNYVGRITPILKENGGQASALNAGFARSRGDLIIFLDSDDVLLPETVWRVIEVFHTNPDVAKVMYRTEVIDAYGVRTGVVKPPSYLPMRSGDLRRHVLTFPFDMTRMSTSGNAFSARILSAIFPIPEHVYGRVGADWYVCYITPLFGTVIFLKEVGAYYRVHDLNNYEAPCISLVRIRETISYMSTTNVYIKKFADCLELQDRPGASNDIFSISYIANRVVSLKLDPLRHPIENDRLSRLLLYAVLASFRRFDVSLPMKLIFLLWFAGMVLAPKPLAWWLAKKFFLPESRAQFNNMLEMLHHD
jgi:glycosyltransferase involved in cell wall biosynthesis